MSCLAKTKYHLNDKGKATIEWYKDGKPQYYCYGYIDNKTDEPLNECRECEKFVGKAYEDLIRYKAEMDFLK